MLEFLQTYGLWIALGVVFIVMNRFGMGCCGGGRHHAKARENGGVVEGVTKGEKPSDVQAERKGRCH